MTYDDRYDDHYGAEADEACATAGIKPIAEAIEF